VLSARRRTGQYGWCGGLVVELHGQSCARSRGAEPSAVPRSLASSGFRAAGDRAWRNLERRALPPSSVQAAAAALTPTALPRYIANSARLRARRAFGDKRVSGQPAGLLRRGRDAPPAGRSVRDLPTPIKDAAAALVLSPNRARPLRRSVRSLSFAGSRAACHRFGDDACVGPPRFARRSLCVSGCQPPAPASAAWLSGRGRSQGWPS
jgi:hypothetical protein